MDGLAYLEPKPRGRRRPDSQGEEGEHSSRGLTPRQLAVARLVSSYKYECKKAFKGLMQWQDKWKLQVTGRRQAPPPAPEIPPIEAPAVKVPHLAAPRTLSGERSGAVWKQTERDAVKRAVLAFGLGRWDRIHDALLAACAATRHTPTDVEDACWDLTHELARRGDVEDAQFLTALEANSGHPPTPPTIGAPFSKLDQSAKHYAKRLRVLDDFNACMAQVIQESHGKLPPVAAPPGPTLRALRELLSNMSDTAPPTPWWNADCDLSLLLGVYKHGYVNYEAVRQDAEYSAIFETARLQSRHADAGGLPEGADMLWPATDVLTRRFKRVNEHLFRAAKSVSKAPLSLSRAQKSRPVSEQKAVWSKRERIELLRAVMAWGLPTFGASATGEEEEVDWETLRMRAGLARKTDGQVEQVYYEILQEANGILDAGTTKTQRKSNHSPDCQCIICNNRRRGLERKAKEEGLDADDPEVIAMLMKREEDELAAEGGELGPEEGGASTEKRPRRRVLGPNQLLTGVTAARLRDRLEVLAALQRGSALLRPAWSSQLALINRTTDLPIWWRPSHDLDLVAGVLKHGYGNWASIFSDPAFGFQAAASRLATPGSAAGGAEGAAGVGGAGGVGAEAGVKAEAEDGGGVDKMESGEEGEGEEGGGKAGSLVLPGFPSGRAMQKRCKLIATVMRRLLKNPRNFKVQDGSAPGIARRGGRGGGRGGPGGRGTRIKATPSSSIPPSPPHAPSHDATPSYPLPPSQEPSPSNSPHAPQHPQHPQQPQQPFAPAPPPSRTPPKAPRRSVTPSISSDAIIPPGGRGRGRGARTPRTVHPGPDFVDAPPSGSPEEYEPSPGATRGRGRGSRARGLSRAAGRGSRLTPPGPPGGPHDHPTPDDDFATGRPRKRRAPGQGTPPPDSSILSMAAQIAASVAAQVGAAPGPPGAAAQGAEPLAGSHGKRRAGGAPAGAAERRPKARREGAAGGSGPGVDGGPLQLPGGLEVLSLGRVVSDRPGFHNELHIYPVGYRAARPYYSIANPQGDTCYYLDILDGGVQPLFKISAADLEHISTSHTNLDSAWKAIIEMVVAARVGQATPQALDGAEMFGLKHPTVIRMIWDLPGARNCTNYRAPPSAWAHHAPAASHPHPLRHHPSADHLTPTPAPAAPAHNPLPASHPPPAPTSFADRFRALNAQRVAAASPTPTDPSSAPTHPPAIPPAATSAALPTASALQALSADILAHLPSLLNLKATGKASLDLDLATQNLHHVLQSTAPLRALAQAPAPGHPAPPALILQPAHLAAAAARSGIPVTSKALAAYSTALQSLAAIPLSAPLSLPLAGPQTLPPNPAGATSAGPSTSVALPPSSTAAAAVPLLSSALNVLHNVGAGYPLSAFFPSLLAQPAGGRAPNVNLATALAQGRAALAAAAGAAPAAASGAPPTALPAAVLAVPAAAHAAAAAAAPVARAAVPAAPVAAPAAAVLPAAAVAAPPAGGQGAGGEQARRPPQGGNGAAA